MQVKLKVIGGKNDGREISISVPEFIIGRGEGSHLRPQSDLISRHHCSVNVENGKVVVKDLKSRNGTFVNGERLEGEVQLKVGDRLRVGRLQFEILIDHAVAGSKKPRVEGVKEAAARAANAGGNSDIDEDSISDWLDSENEQEYARRTDPETRQFRFDETERLTLDGDQDESKSSETTILSDQDTSSGKEVPESGKEAAGKKKRSFGKLPNRAGMDSVDSKDAASQMLKNFFNRR